MAEELQTDTDYLTGTIGRACHAREHTFVPILGQFRFGAPNSYQPGAEVVSALTDDAYLIDQNCWWVCARLIQLFEFASMTSRNLSSSLEFQFAAIPRLLGSRRLVYTPVLLEECCDGEFEPTYAGLRFTESTPPEVVASITSDFWQTLLLEPSSIGIFCDYWALGWHEVNGLDVSSEGELYCVSCDGERLMAHHLGQLCPVDSIEDSDSIDLIPTFPFELPRKRKRIR